MQTEQINTIIKATLEKRAAFIIADAKWQEARQAKQNLPSLTNQALTLQEFEDRNKAEDDARQRVIDCEHAVHEAQRQYRETLEPLFALIPKRSAGIVLEYSGKKYIARYYNTHSDTYLWDLQDYTENHN